MKFYRFKVTYWNVFEERNEIDCGFVFSEGYAGAAEKLEQWYGEDLVSIDFLCETDNEVVLLDENIRETWNVNNK